MPAKKTKKPSSKRVNGDANKLISIRIPEKIIRDLQQQAGKQGGIGYQKLIKAYIANGLAKETPAASVESAPRRVAHSTSSRPMRSPDSIPDVMREDIDALGKIFKPYQKQFEGKTFLITGAFGFLGRYMVHLLHYMNEKVLSRPCKGLLLDNFVTGYEQRIISDENLMFLRHDVIKPFQTDAKIDYIIHAAGIASP